MVFKFFFQGFECFVGFQCFFEFFCFLKKISSVFLKFFSDDTRIFCVSRLLIVF